MVFAVCATEAPAGYPNENNNHPGDDRKKEKDFSLSSFHCNPRAFIFPSPQPPYDTKRPLRRGERVVFVKTLLSDKVYNSVTMVNINDRFSSTVGNKPAKKISIYR